MGLFDIFKPKPSKPSSTPSTSVQGLTKTVQANAEAKMKTYPQGSITLILNTALANGSNQLTLYTPAKAAVVPITNSSICSLLGFTTFQLPSTVPVQLPYITSVIPGSNTTVIMIFGSKTASPQVKKNVVIKATSSDVAPVTTTIASIISNSANGLTSDYQLMALMFGTGISDTAIQKLKANTAIPTVSAPTVETELFTVGNISVPIPNGIDSSNNTGDFRIYLILLVFLIIMMYYLYKVQNN